ncbi:MAG: hypothetical protein RLZZ241_2495 [Bacteroidota bacterium]
MSIFEDNPTNFGRMLELASIVIFGILAQWVAWRFKLPAILPLILIGLLVGPISTLFTEDGAKLIEPVWNGEAGLFPGDGLYYFVSLAISIILFEGGLTLKLSEVSNVGPVITKLITLGTVITFFGAGISAHALFELSWEISFLFSALIIVTGPTVIAPILRNIPLKKDVSAVLKWEGILIDPIGALVSVLVFEFISVGEGQAYTRQALVDFGKIILFGFTFGFTFAHGLAAATKRNLIPHYLLNVVSLSAALSVFVISDVFAHESGLLAVVVMGLVLGNINLPNLKELLYFKESLSLLLISILFILLAANVNLEDMWRLYTWKTGVLFAIIVFIIRPLGVLLSTQGSGLKTKEKLFISWVGPRGIVAAGIASLFGARLVAKGEPGAEFITPLVFTVVLGTVLLNATTARPFAKIIGVFLKTSDGILMVGASKVSRLIAQYLLRNNRHVVLLDNNPLNIEKAKNQGLEAFTANIYSDNIADNLELTDVGYLLAMTANPEINQFVIEKFQEQFGENGSFRIADADELNSADIANRTGMFSHTDDFVSMMDAVRKNPAIHELDLKTPGHFLKTLKIAQENPDVIPLFLKYPSGFLNLIPHVITNPDEIREGYKLVYMGQVLDEDPES